jgi:hypothetical protein
VREALATVAARLTRGRLAALAVALVTIAGAAVLVGVFARGWWRGEGGSYAPRSLVASARITPPSSLFGDLLDARVDVLVDPRRVDPGSVQLDARFRPYAVRSQSTRVARGVGRASLVEFRYAIQCITASCIGLMSQGTGAKVSTKAIQLPPAKLTARARDGSPVALPVTWPTFAVHSRLSAPEIALSTPQAEPTFSPPPVSWNVSPGVLGGAAVSAAALLVLGAGWLVATTLLGDTRRLRPRRIPAHLTPVERALRLAEHAARTGELDEERKALQRLAVELRRAGNRELAGRAGRLAWSEGEPSSDTVGALAEAVRSNGAR